MSRETVSSETMSGETVQRVPENLLVVASLLVDATKLPARRERKLNLYVNDKRTPLA
jgi:hypothetical protein